MHDYCVQFSFFRNAQPNHLIVQLKIIQLDQELDVIYEQKKCFTTVWVIPNGLIESILYCILWWLNEYIQ